MLYTFIYSYFFLPICLDLRFYSLDLQTMLIIIANVFWVLTMCFRHCSKSLSWNNFRIHITPLRRCRQHPHFMHENSGVKIKVTCPAPDSNLTHKCTSPQGLCTGGHEHRGQAAIQHGVCNATHSLSRNSYTSAYEIWRCAYQQYTVGGESQR